MALVISMGWIAMGLIVFLYQFGKTKLSGSISETCGFILFPAAVLVVIAMVKGNNSLGYMGIAAVYAMFIALCVSSPTTRARNDSDTFYGIISFITIVITFPLVVQTGTIVFNTEAILAYNPIPYFLSFVVAFVFSFYMTYVVLSIMGYET